jgi:hypothetical protein
MQIAYLIFYDITNIMEANEIIALVGSIVIPPTSVAIGLLIKSYFDIKRDEMIRVQNRADAETLANLTSTQNQSLIEKAQEILAAGEARKNEFIKEVKVVQETAQQTKAVALKSALKSQEAINVANGHNEKIANAVDISKKVLEKFVSPMEVTVKNDTDHPIPVEVENRP